MNGDDDDIIITGRERIARDRRRYSQRETYIFPRPRNVRSSESRFHPGSWLVLALILAALAGIGYWIYSYQYGTETTITMTVNRLDDQASGNNKHKYLVFTKGTGGQPGEVLQDTDAFWHWKWNSSDVFAALEPGHTYSCKIYGHRNHLTSSYRNILSCTPVQAGALGLYPVQVGTIGLHSIRVGEQVFTASRAA
jgi:hypothetical protein